MAEQNNFDLIWGQNSPLTPYAFSDADYQEGWNFVGSTPPARTMFDAVQQRNDTKSRELHRRVAAIEAGETPHDREPAQEYEVGDFATIPALPTGYYLQCVVAGTTSAGIVTVDNPYVGNIVSDGNVKWVILCWPTKEKILARSTAYAIGDIVEYQGQRLVCVKDGTTSYDAVSLAGKAEGALIADGTAYWELDSFADGHYDAPHQNGVYRGVDITEYWDSGYMSANIRAGRFVGIHIGDVITKTIDLPAITYTDKSGVSQSQEAQTFDSEQWLLAAFDPHFKAGDEDKFTTFHHILLISANALQRNVTMNPTSDTEGGYLGSDMWNIHMSNWANAIKTAFGASHVLLHRELLSNAVNKEVISGGVPEWNGRSSTWAWADVEVNIPNEAMVYGSAVFGSARDWGDFAQQLPLFNMTQYVGGLDRSWYWLRTVAASNRFGSARGNGLAGWEWAYHVGSAGGIRPYFLAY